LTEPIVSVVVVSGKKKEKKKGYLKTALERSKRRMVY